MELIPGQPRTNTQLRTHTHTHARFQEKIFRKKKKNETDGSEFSGIRGRINRKMYYHVFSEIDNSAALPVVPGFTGQWGRLGLVFLCLSLMYVCDKHCPDMILNK